MVKAFALTLATIVSTLVLTAAPAHAGGGGTNGKDTSWGCGGSCRSDTSPP